MFDEDGNDVTPAPLVQLEPVLGKGPSKGSVAGDQSADGTQVRIGLDNYNPLK